MSNGDIIEFDYKRGHVIAIVKYFDDKTIVGKLLTDYYGKNTDWEIGEFKNFNIKEMKNITIKQTEQ